VGGIGRVFDFTLEYMNDRYASGRPISSYQALKHRVADPLLILESARACCDAAVAAFDGCRADASTEASVAKAYVEEFTPLWRNALGGGLRWRHKLTLCGSHATHKQCEYRQDPAHF
jgi:hypothetical protein